MERWFRTVCLHRHDSIRRQIARRNTATVTPPTEIDQNGNIDEFINVCIDGGYKIYSKNGGDLYCDVGGGTTFAAGGWPAPPQPPPPKLTAKTARTTFLAQMPVGIHIPPREGEPCPAVEIFHGQSECYVEYRLAARWYLIGGVVRIKNRKLVVSRFSSGSWVRKWRRCSLRGWPVPGVLTSNNNCGREGGESDAYFVGQEMWHGSVVNGHVSWLTPGWQFTDSAGFDSIGSFPCKLRRRTYVCTNAVGDSFKFTP